MAVVDIINQYYNGDCLEVLPLTPDNCLDLIIIDPPFIVPKHFATRTFFRKGFGELGVMEFFFKNVFSQIERTLKDTGMFYVHCSEDSYPLFWYYTYPFTKKVRLLTWNKVNSINGYHWRHQTEFILFGIMPNTPKVPTGDGDIIECRAVKAKDRVHGAEKPMELIDKLILKSSQEGDIVADFFAGSGVVLKSAKKLKRNYFGIEYDKGYYERSKLELENMKNGIEEWL